MRLRISAALAALTFAVSPLSAQTVVYNNLPAVIPDNVPSFGYQANQIAALGDLVHLAPGPRNLSSLTAMMSTWAFGSSYSDLFSANPAGWDLNMTISLYNVGAGNTVGSTLGSLTQQVLIPWRAAPSPAQCGNLPDYGTFGQYFGADNLCHGGQAFELGFDFTSMGIVLPDDIIYEIAFNTQTWGYDPTGVAGPYNSLNVGATLTPPSVGTNEPNTAAEAYGANPVFATDQGWDYKPMVRIETTSAAATTVPEPSTWALMAVGLVAIAGASARKRGNRATFAEVNAIRAKACMPLRLA